MKPTASQWGHFDPEQREYVITDPRTPTPWMNYLFNEDYYCLISNTGGGYSFYKSARDYRILRMRLNTVPHDRPGRYIYVRDRDTGAYWSTGWAPVMPALDTYTYRCRHGFGYTIIHGATHDIATETTYTVARQAPLEVWACKITNTGNTVRRLTLFSYAEFCLFQAMHDMQNFQYTYNVARCEVEPQLIHHVTAAYDRPWYAFAGVSEPATGFDTDREAFMGDGYHTEANPQVVARGQSAQSLINGGNPIASFAYDLELAPGETREWVVIVGYDPGGAPGARRAVAEYARPGIGEELVKAWRTYWDECLAANQIETPDTDFNLVLNQWLAYQSQVTFRVSRGPSIYEGGIGRGMGTRDSSQDILGALCLTPHAPRKLLLDLAGIQFREGSMYHQFFPLTGEGDGGNSFSDDALWFVMAVTEYLKASGDMALLDEPVRWADDPAPASLLDHLKAAVAYTRRMRGAHGLPLILLADWNDMLQISGLTWGDDHHGRDDLRAESVMVAFLYRYALTAMEELMLHLGDSDTAATYRAQITELQAAIDAHAWDGEWFRRAFDNEGRVVGGKGDPFAEVWLNTQTWAVLSGSASGARAEQAMRVVAERLETPYGLILLDPPYAKWQASSPSITTYPPGLKENGGIFCHTNPWAVIAHCLLGNGDQAMDYFRRIMPTTHQAMQATYQAEPYVYAQMIAGRHHPQFGRARNSWLTGAVAWNYVAASNYIMGVQPTYTGVRLAPCLPKDWTTCRVRRRIRDIDFDIRIEQRPDSAPNGYHSVTVRCEQAEVEGNLVKWPTTNHQGPLVVQVEITARS